MANELSDAQRVVIEPPLPKNQPGRPLGPFGGGGASWNNRVSFQSRAYDALAGSTCESNFGYGARNRTKMSLVIVA
jgi:hypothetical protein